MKLQRKKLDRPNTIRRLFHKLKRSPIYSFPKYGYMKSFTPQIPEGHGVYIIYSPHGRVVHVGRTLRGSGLIRRLNSHLQGQSSFVAYYLDGSGKKLRRGYKFKYIMIPNPRQRALVEALATGVLCPAHLGLGLPLNKTK